MKTHTNVSVVALLALMIIISCVTKVAATVGGDAIIYDFKYNPVNESIYYIKEDFSGRGCPPTLLKVSLSSEKVTADLSCDQGEKMSLEQVGSTINTITGNFKFLTPLNLKRNNIMVDIAYTKSENYSEEINEIIVRHFIASIYQNGKKIKEIPITGCSLDQPFTFQGYSVPGFDKKIALLLSAKGNCFEGGYTTESVYVVGELTQLDKTVTGNFYKRPSALVPNEGNLVVYESDAIIGTTEALHNYSSTTRPCVDSSTKESLFQLFVNWLKSAF